MNKKVLGTVIGGMLVFASGTVSYDYMHQNYVMAAENPLIVSEDSITIKESVENYLYVLFDQNRLRNVQAVKGDGSSIEFTHLKVNKNYRIDMYEIDDSVQFSINSDGVTVVSGQTLTDPSKVMVIDNQQNVVGMVPYFQNNKLEKSAGWPTNPVEAFYIPGEAISGDVKTKKQATVMVIGDTIQIVNTNSDKAYMIVNEENHIDAIISGNGGTASISVTNLKGQKVKVIEAENMDDQSPTERQKAIAMDSGVKMDRIYIVKDGQQIITYKKGENLSNNATTIPLNDKHLVNLEFYIVTDVDMMNVLDEITIPLDKIDSSTSLETEKTETGTPEVEKTETKTPETETPEVEKTETETLETKTLEVEKTETETPETKTPEVEKTETETPETGTPEVEKTETETPEVKPSETEITNSGSLSNNTQNTNSQPTNNPTSQQVGWQKDTIHQNWQYFNKEGQMIKNQWVGEYYLKSDGYMAKNEWIFDKQSNSWFYLTSDGKYAQNQWVGSYYLKQWGYMAKNEWIFDSTYEAWYYLKDNGHYAYNEIVNGYKLDKFGKWM